MCHIESNILEDTTSRPQNIYCRNDDDMYAVDKENHLHRVATAMEDNSVLTFTPATSVMNMIPFIDVVVYGGDGHYNQYTKSLQTPAYIYTQTVSVHNATKPEQLTPSSTQLKSRQTGASVAKKIATSNKRS